ncbi:MAG: DUF3105 domain-containing protein [Dehalococcoidia bacterium]
MSQNRRARNAQRRRRPEGAPAGAPPPKRGRPQWRETIDSWGGFTVIGAAVLVLVAVVFLVFVQSPFASSPSDDALMGEEFADVRTSHVAVGTLGDPPPQPPAGGPHYVQPWPTGVFEETPPDGHLIHSLEHGIIWMSYHPDMVSEEELDNLRDVAGDHSNDVILAPRPQNDAPLYLLSWGRRMQADPNDTDLLREFIETNVNRAPEFVR